MTRAADMHMHIGFAQDCAACARLLDDADIIAFSNTVSPDEYCELKSKLEVCTNLRIGVGMHPWWLDKVSLDQFIEMANEAAFIGEVGLDFWPSHAHNKKQQLVAFEAMAKTCALQGEKIISLHSVNAERELLDILEANGCTQRCTCILHSYSGPSDQLVRAVDAGCLFSVGPRMLASKKGREYTRVIPHDRLLLETDLPAAPEDTMNVSELTSTLQSLVDEIALIRGCDSSELAAELCERGRRLLKL